MREFVSKIRIAVAVLFALMAVCSCKTKYMPVESVRTEVAYRDRVQRDSVMIHDSVYVHVKGDTVVRERWNTTYRDRWMRDTCYVSKTDTLKVPYEVIKEIKGKQTKWQRFFGTSGIVCWLLVIIAAGIRLNKKWNWISKLIAMIKKIL